MIPSTPSIRTTSDSRAHHHTTTTMFPYWYDFLFFLKKKYIYTFFQNAQLFQEIPLYIFWRFKMLSWETFVLSCVFFIAALLSKE